MQIYVPGKESFSIVVFFLFLEGKNESSLLHRKIDYLATNQYEFECALFKRCCLGKQSSQFLKTLMPMGD
jgi:hypothetical protein